jgi:hypothetical protein
MRCVHAALHEVCISDTCSGAQLCLTVMGAMHVRSSSSKAGKVSILGSHSLGALADMLCRGQPLVRWFEQFPSWYLFLLR